VVKPVDITVATKIKHLPTGQPYLEVSLNGGVVARFDLVDDDGKPIVFDEHFGGALPETWTDRQLQEAVDFLEEVFPSSPEQATWFDLVREERCRRALEKARMVEENLAEGTIEDLVG
jgi:hypothetical protein